MSFMKENNEPNIFGSKFNNNNFIYKKIDNFPSKRNIREQYWECYGVLLLHC